MHAAHLFAVWQARRKYGAAAECKLLIQTELKQDGARFEAVIAHRDRPARKLIVGNPAIRTRLAVSAPLGLTLKQRRL